MPNTHKMDNEDLLSQIPEQWQPAARLSDRFLQAMGEGLQPTDTIKTGDALAGALILLLSILRMIPRENRPGEINVLAASARVCLDELLAVDLNQDAQEMIASLRNARMDS